MRNGWKQAVACLLLCIFFTTALTAPAQATSPSFSDVPASCWAAGEITRAVQAGLFQGETARTFGLGHRMTRAAFVTVLCRLFGWQTVTPDRGSFTDNQNKSAWYYSAVETAVAEGALSRQDSVFRPDDPVTREEIAVMLVRALGCGTIAGLSQGLSLPFTDVVSNAGYLSMAYRLGIVGGTSPTTFSPNAPATREQAAVMLMRVYDKLHSSAALRLGVAKSADGLTDLSGLDAVAVSAATLSCSGSLTCLYTMSYADRAEIRWEARNAGALSLLGVTGGSAQLGFQTAAAAQAIADQVEEDDWDGVLLDFSGLSAARREDYTGLVTTLKSALGRRPLYVVAEAPVSGGATSGGYDYAALGQQADGLILRVAGRSEVSGSFPILSPEPLEDVYYAMASAAQTVDPSKLSLWLTTTGSAWAGNRATGSVPAEEIEALLASPDVSVYRSERYGSAYLVRTVKDSRTVVWYNDGEGAALRMRLAAFLGSGGLCLSDLSSVADEADYSLRGVLK